jgi:hypothetical protein
MALIGGGRRDRFPLEDVRLRRGLATSAFVPFLGANLDVDLGAHTITATRFISSATTLSGLAPFTVNSTVLVANLNADLLDGQHMPTYTTPLSVTAGVSPVVSLAGLTTIGTATYLVRVNAAGTAWEYLNPATLLAGYVPYTGATADVDLGTHFLKAAQIRTPEIKTDATAPTDLTITTGAVKTLLLATPVYQDLTAGVDPSRVTGTTNTVMVGNIRELVFSNGDTADFPAVELLHGYKSGTDFEFHLHIATRGTNASAYHVRYTLEYSLAPVDGVFGATTTLDVETTIAGGTTALTHKYIDLGVVSGAGLVLGTQVKYVLKKIASASSDAPAANNPYVLAVGIHYQVDTVGSRNETTK